MGYLKKLKKKSKTWYRKKLVAQAKIEVRKRDKKCQKCGSKKNLHCSHVYPEAEFKHMSADPLNMKLLCYRCHFWWWHRNTMDAAEWFKNKFPERYLILSKMSKVKRKINWEKKYESKIRKIL